VIGAGLGAGALCGGGSLGGWLLPCKPLLRFSHESQRRKGRESCEEKPPLRAYVRARVGAR
jgi:hypothetical protein